MPAHAADVTIYAAASLTNAVQDIAVAYQLTHPEKIKVSFAASSLLAKQIEAGAPADIFASADRKWMDYLAAQQLINTNSRRDLLGNTLVLIAPVSVPAPRPIEVVKNKVPDFSGHLCMGDSASVPAGIYGKQVLVNLGWWTALQKKVVGTEDVRSALAFVARKECSLGLVYETDARISDQVVIVARFPGQTHDAIVYPFALLPKASPAAKEFFAYLQGADAQKVFLRYGFSVLSR
jgi:molybdate transport system substrate-binding protein